MHINIQLCIISCNICKPICNMYICCRFVCNCHNCISYKSVKSWHSVFLRLILVLCHKILCIIYKTSFHVEILILVQVVTTHMSLTNKKYCKVIQSARKITIVYTLERNISPCSQFLVNKILMHKLLEKIYIFNIIYS